MSEDFSGCCLNQDLTDFMDYPDGCYVVLFLSKIYAIISAKISANQDHHKNHNNHSSDNLPQKSAAYFRSGYHTGRFLPEPTVTVTRNPTVDTVSYKWRYYYKYISQLPGKW
ncbi:hypothetical protein CLV51_10825 [Chitinophaga niastensis]|uniref:Uncharacterized protein n=1 Tax=Chitinophaga niastensis TaxID=536980 RepID=A0A2P8HAT5_CHINA|nr:hypothetical protein CLV51_10825 [Chitinophaga niastensis]